MRQATREGARAAIVDALGFINDSAALKAIVESLKDRSPTVRLVAARALRKSRTASAADALVAALKDPEVRVRLAAVDSILEVSAGSRLPAVVPILLHALRNESTLARQRAATLLGRVADPRAIGDLVTALSDKEEEVRRAAEEALTRFGSAGQGLLIRALKDRSAEVRRASARILGRIGSLEAIDPLLEALRDPDEWVRAHAAEYLRKLGDQRAIPPFIVALRDSNPIVRNHAAAVLGELGDQKVVKPLLLAAGEGPTGSECLGALIAIMAMHAIEVDPEDLRAMAEFTRRPATSSDGRVSATTPEEDMNSSALRQLAREELSRRGLRLP
jgi:HEAT repeat protein